VSLDAERVPLIQGTIVKRSRWWQLQDRWILRSHLTWPRPERLEQCCKRLVIMSRIVNWQSRKPRVLKIPSMYCIADLMMTCVVNAWCELMAKANNLGGCFAGAGRLCACSCSFGARLGACQWDAIHEALLKTECCGWAEPDRFEIHCAFIELCTWLLYTFLADGQDYRQ